MRRKLDIGALRPELGSAAHLRELAPTAGLLRSMRKISGADHVEECVDGELQLARRTFARHANATSFRGREVVARLDHLAIQTFPRQHRLQGTRVDRVLHCSSALQPTAIVELRRPSRLVIPDTPVTGEVVDIDAIDTAAQRQRLPASQWNHQRLRQRDALGLAEAERNLEELRRDVTACLLLDLQKHLARVEQLQTLSLEGLLAGRRHDAPLLDHGLLRNLFQPIEERQRRLFPRRAKLGHRHLEHLVQERAELPRIEPYVWVEQQFVGHFQPQDLLQEIAIRTARHRLQLRRRIDLSVPSRIELGGRCGDPSVPRSDLIGVARGRRRRPRRKHRIRSQ